MAFFCSPPKGGVGKSQYKYVFRVCINSTHFARLMVGIADFFKRENGFDKACFMVQDVLWARASSGALEGMFKKRGLKILGEEKV